MQIKETTTYADIIHGIQALGLENSTLSIHTSLKSFGQLDGGPRTLIQGLLDSGCTIVVPTFTYNCRVPAPVENHYPQNGCVYPYEPNHVEPYDRESEMIASSMGAIPAEVLKQEQRVRGIHPINSFAAVGPLAEELIAAQTYLDVYGPFKRMTEMEDAYVVLIGVDLTTATAIHYAEELAGRTLFREWGLEKDGTQREVAVGSCSDGFNRFDPYVKGLERSVMVGESQWRLFPFWPFIEAISATFAVNQEITHCGDQACLRCRDAVMGGPLLFL